MDGGEPGRPAVGERLGERSGELGIAAGQRGEAEVARPIAADRVQPEHCQAMARTGRLHVRGGNVVGPMDLDGTEARARGGVDPLEERPVGPEEAEIGGEASHQRGLKVSSRSVISAASR